MYKQQWFCRWCGNTYTPHNETERDGFCDSACKMALHRAFKKYVTRNIDRSPGKKRSSRKK